MGPRVQPCTTTYFTTFVSLTWLIIGTHCFRGQVTPKQCKGGARDIYVIHLIDQTSMINSAKTLCQVLDKVILYYFRLAVPLNN